MARVIKARVTATVVSINPTTCAAALTIALVCATGSAVHAACEPGRRASEQVLHLAMKDPIKDFDVKRYATNIGRMSFICELFSKEFNVRDVLFDSTTIYVVKESGDVKEARKIAQSGCSKLPYRDQFRFDIYFVSHSETMKAHHPIDYWKMDKRFWNICSDNQVRWPPED